jgi:medium-chain acyl-[acyl-carrier-protein] hydrolase
MPAGVDVCPVQPPGRENRIRESPLRRTGALVEAMDEALRPLVDRPFALFGYSMGATVAFEWAQHLRRTRGVEPERLIVAARAAPQVPRLWPEMYSLPDRQMKRQLLELAGTPPEILENEELMEILLPLLRADFEIHDTYAPSSLEPLDCPIDVFGGVDDPAVPEEHLRAWEAVTRAECRLRRLPGDHFGLLRGEPLTDEVRRLLESTLAS